MGKILLTKMPNEYIDLYKFLINNYYYSNHKNINLKIEVENDKKDFIFIKYKKSLENINIEVFYNEVNLAKIYFIRGGFADKQMYIKLLDNNENFFNLKFITYIKEIMENKIDYLQNIKFSDFDILMNIEKTIKELKYF